jgi:hypothetical protein
VINLGYVPYSEDLGHPADRRRIASWAKATGTKLNLTDPLKSDLLVLSNSANFGKWLRQATQPVVLDLVDGYLGENPTIMKDVGRNLLRSYSGTSEIRWMTYTNHLRQACKMSSGVIVASPEQRELILDFNSNIEVILDDHTEVREEALIQDNLRHTSLRSETRKNLFWEGLPINLKHFQHISDQIDDFLFENNWGLYLLTKPNFARWGDNYVKLNTSSYIRKFFRKSSDKVLVIPWSITNIVKYAARSLISIIPIDPVDKFAMYKSENKLLSMWSIPIATLTSRSPSYVRAGQAANLEEINVDASQWYSSLSKLSKDLDRIEYFREVGLAHVRDFHTKYNRVASWQNLIDRFS